MQPRSGVILQAGIHPDPGLGPAGRHHHLRAPPLLARGSCSPGSARRPPPTAPSSQAVRSRTFSAASRVNPPWNTAHWAKAAFSHGSRSSHEPSIAVSSVEWRPFALPRRRPAAVPLPPRTRNRSRMRSTISRGAITVTRAAASSIASGIPSTSFTSSRTDSAAEPSRSQADSCLRARSAKSAAADSTVSGSRI